MKTFTLRVLKSFHDANHDVKREKKSSFEETDEARAKKLIDLGYVGLLSVTPQPEAPTKSEKYVNPVEPSKAKFTMENGIKEPLEKPKKKRKKRKDSGTQSTSSQPEQELSV